MNIPTGKWADLEGTEVPIVESEPIEWANEAEADTQKVVTFLRPDSLPTKAAIVVVNPSLVSDLTVKLFSVEVGLDADGLIDSFVVPKKQTITGTEISAYVEMVYGAFNGCDLKLVISNNTTLEADGAFTATVRIRALA